MGAARSVLHGLGRQVLHGRLILHAVILCLVVIWLLPTLGTLVTSFRRAPDINDTGWWTVLSQPFNFTQYTLENYHQVITKQGLGRAFLNSLIITVPATLLPLFIASFAAFGFAWMDFRGRDLLFMLSVGLLVVPLQMTFIPILKVFNTLHLSGTYLGIWLAHTGYGMPLTLYLMHNFISELPRDLFDSAAIDGASPLQMFFRIVIPLSVPAIASVTIFQFLWVWNDLLVALIYLGGSPKVAPLTLTIANLVGSRGQAWWLLTAAAFLSMVLPLVVFFSMQRYFIRGILAGSVKG
ncbi:MAG: carbohydrate ABC transporter permease [Candidatus Bipolaricaulaceae bacterium]